MREDFQLGDCLISPRRGFISRGGEVVHIHPRPMAVLVRLAEAGGEVVSRQDLFEAVWPDTIVTDDALTQCIVELRKAFGDCAHNSRFIRTIPKLGFSLVPRVRSVPKPPPSGRKPRAALAVALCLLLVAVLYFPEWPGAGEQGGATEPEILPAVAVLRFTDLGLGETSEFFADGLAEDLINELGNMHGLRTIGRASSFRFSGDPDELSLVRHALEVTHVITGSIRRQPGEVRVTVSLMDAATGHQLWGQSYDRPTDDLFDVQSEISGSVRNALAAILNLPQMDAAAAEVNIVPRAFEAFLKGRYLVAQQTVSSLGQGIEQFRRALEIDPDYAQARAELALAMTLLHQSSGQPGYAVLVEEVTQHADRALSQDPDLASALLALGAVRRLSGDPEDANRYFSKAMAARHNDALAYAWSAAAMMESGRYQEAFSLRHEALTLDPLSVGAIVDHFGDLLDRGLRADAAWEMDKLTYLHPMRHMWCHSLFEGEAGNWSARALAALESYLVSPDNRVAMLNFASMLSLFGLERELLEFSEYPDVLHSAMIFLGREEIALDLAEQLVANNPVEPGYRVLLARSLARLGRYGDAQPLFEEMWQRGRQRVTRDGVFQGLDALALFRIRQAAGDDSGAGEVLAALRENNERYRLAGFTSSRLRFSPHAEKGAALFLEGDRTRAMDYFAQATAGGYYWNLSAAFLQEFYTEPRFVPLRDLQETRVVTERDRFLVAACSDSQFANRWRPSRQSCEMVDAAGP